MKPKSAEQLRKEQVQQGKYATELRNIVNRLNERAKATKASEKGKSAQEAKNNAVKFIRNYLNSGFTGGYEGSYAQKPTTTKGTGYIQQNNPLNYSNKPNVTYNNVSTALPNKDARKPKEVPSAGNTKPTPETSEGYSVRYTQNSGNKDNPIFNTSTNNDSKYTYSGSKDYKNTKHEQPKQTDYFKMKYSKPHHADRSKEVVDSYKNIKPTIVETTSTKPTTTPNKLAPNNVETTSVKAPTPTPTPTKTPTTPTRAPARSSRGTAGKGVGILAAINANDAIKKAFETESLAPIWEYGLNLATGGVSGEIKQAYNDGAFDPAPNASVLGAAWDAAKAIVDPMSYWNLAKDIATGTVENVEDIYNNFADYAWRDNNVPPPPPPTSTPAPTAPEDNWLIPELPDEISDDSEGDWVIPDHNFDTSPENYYNLANSGVLGNGKDRLKNWIELGGNEESYQAGQKYLNDMFAKSYARNKINEKVNASAPVVAPRPTPQEVRARKAQQDEMLRQKMLETAQNPNSSVRRNMPSYFNSSTTLQNYYLNNPDLWGKN